MCGCWVTRRERLRPQASLGTQQVAGAGEEEARSQHMLPARHLEAIAVLLWVRRCELGMERGKRSRALSRRGCGWRRVFVGQDSALSGTVRESKAARVRDRDCGRREERQFGGERETCYVTVICTATCPSDAGTGGHLILNASGSRSPASRRMNGAVRWQAD